MCIFIGTKSFDDADCFYIEVAVYYKYSNVSSAFVFPFLFSNAIRNVASGRPSLFDSGDGGERQI